MEIIIAENAGFCFGVKRAIKLAEKTVESEKYSYSSGELVHNPQVVKKFSDKGLKIVNDFENQKKGTVILRSHGTHPLIKDKIKSLGHNYIDCTCPVLLSMYRKIEKKNKRRF